MRCDRTTRPLRSRITSFLVASTVLLVIWLGVLPRLAQTPSLKQYLDRNEELGIDPGAKFYTELPGMRRIIERVQTAHRLHGAEFWTVSNRPAVEND